MATFDELAASDPYARLLAEATRTGYFKLETRGGKQGMEFMGKFYTDPTELAKIRRKLDVKMLPHKITGGILESMPQNMGQMHYGGLESAVRKVRKTVGNNFWLERSSFGADADIDELSRMLIDQKTGTEYGFMVPDSTGTVLFQGFTQGKDGPERVTRRELVALFEHTGVLTTTNIPKANTVTAAQLDASYAKLSKRMKRLINAERYDADLGPTRAVIFGTDASDYSKLYGFLNPEGMQEIVDKGLEGGMKTVYDGLSIVSPNLVQKMKDKMQARAIGLKEELDASRSTMSPHLQRQTENTISNIWDDIGDLNRLLNQGGRLEGLRISNFDEGYLRAMGIEDQELIDTLLSSMGKGDAYAIPKKKWKDVTGLFSEGLGHTTMQRQIVTQADILIPFASDTLEMGTTVGTTFKATKTKGTVRVDEQLLAGSGRELLMDADGSFDSLVKTNVDSFSAAIRNLKAGHIHPAYLKQLQDIAAGAGELGSIPELINQQGRARRILASLELGRSPATDRDLFNEISRGYMEFMKREQFGSKSLDLAAQIPYSISGHVGTDVIPRLMGMTEGDIEAGTFGFNKKFGLIYSAEDAIEYTMKAHGGGDLDDLLGSVLRLDESDIVGFNKRAPYAAGESVVMKLDEKSIQTVARMMTTDTSTPLAQNASLRDALKGLGFFDKGWDASDPVNQSDVADILSQHLAGLRDLDSAKQTSYVAQAGGGFAPPTLPGALNTVVNDPNWHAPLHTPMSFLDDLKSQMDYISFQEPKTIDDYFSKGLQDLMSDDSIATWKQIIGHQQNQGALEQNALAREMADQMAGTAKFLGVEGVEGVLRPFGMEPIIDLLTKGTAEGYPDLGASDIRVLTEGLNRQMAEMVIKAQGQGINLFDPTRFEASTGRNKGAVSSINAHLVNLGGTKVEDYYMDPHSREAVESLARQAQESIMGQTGTIREQALAGIPENPIFSKTHFSQAAIDDAERLKVAYEQALQIARDGRTGLPDRLAQYDMFGEVIAEVDDPDFHHRYATEEVRRVLADMFEDTGVMGDRASYAVGAFIQRHSDLGSGRIMKSGQLADAYTRAEATIGLNNGLMVPMRSRTLAVSADYMTMDIGSEMVTSGAQRATAMSKAYSTAIDAVRGPHGRAVLDVAKEIWDVPIAKKGIIGAAALLGGSLLYRSRRDRSVDDFAGPPLLPGGSFYEQSTHPDMPAGYGPSSGNQESGYSYKINARGDFDPAQLAASAQSISGVQATGSITKSMSRVIKSPFEAYAGSQ